MTAVSRRRFLQGAAGGGAAVAAGALGVSRLDGGDAKASADGLVDWRGPRQAGIVTPRTEYGMVAAFDVVGDDLPGLLRDLTLRIAELTQGWPDRLDPIDNAALPPSDTGEMGYERRNDGRLTITVGFGASLFDGRFGLAGRRPAALSRMPDFPGDNLAPGRTHGDIVLIVQSDSMLGTHHALRDVMRRTKGRLEGRWAQPCFHKVNDDVAERDVAATRGLLGFKDGTRNLDTERDAPKIFTGDEAEPWARNGSYVAIRIIRLKLERWDRLSMTSQERSIGRRKLDAAPLEGGQESSEPRLGAETPRDAHIRMAARNGDRGSILRRGFVYTNGFDEYGLLDSGSMFMAFCADVQKQFEATKRRMRGQDLDEYAVAVGGGYFFCPPGVRGEGDFIGRGLVSS